MSSRPSKSELQVSDRLASHSSREETRRMLCVMLGAACLLMMKNGCADYAPGKRGLQVRAVSKHASQCLAALTAVAPQLKA